MISNLNNIIKRLVAIAIAFAPTHTIGQDVVVENAIFWEITRDDLPGPSYLFGTFHLLDQRYLDTLLNVRDKFVHTEKFVSEIVYDSTLMYKLVASTLMKDSTLDQLLPAPWYQKTDEWIQELSTYDLPSLNRMNPISVQMLITNLLQVKLYDTIDKPIDLYLEDLAKEDGKATFGLETIDDQLQALYHLSYKRQSELLIGFVSNKETATDDLIRLNEMYVAQDLVGLQTLSQEAYTDEELHVMLDMRNMKWMEKIPPLIKQTSCFIAVGALHLAGKDGLVNQLRKAGFSLTPIPLD